MSNGLAVCFRIVCGACGLRESFKEWIILPNHSLFAAYKLMPLPTTKSTTELPCFQTVVSLISMFVFYVFYINSVITEWKTVYFWCKCRVSWDRYPILIHLFGMNTVAQTWYFVFNLGQMVIAWRANIDEIPNILVNLALFCLLVKMTHSNCLCWKLTTYASLRVHNELLCRHLNWNWYENGYGIAE